MHQEINLDTILVLERQIEERHGCEETVIQLKRTRNSLLNVSILLPPEILGDIFRWNAIPVGDFGGVPKGSYNFLLVCHYWFEVASRTPELWSFWGNTVQDWTHRHHRCGTAPLDLVLAKYPTQAIDDKLREALRDRTARDLVRRVHLRGVRTAGLFNTVISILTEVEETQSNSVESFIIDSTDKFSVDVFPFLSRCNLPKLRCLRLSGCMISSWELLKSHTMALTTLELADHEQSLALTPAHLLSILSSNPLLQHLTLSPSSVADVVDGDGTPAKIPLRHLKRLRLKSNFRAAFGLLNRLELPDKIDNIYLNLDSCSHSDISNTLGPFLGDYVRRRGGFSGGGLGLLAYPTPFSFDFNAGDTREGDDSAEVVWFAEVSGFVDVELDDDEAHRLCLGLISHIPREQVISLQTSLPILPSGELCVEMHNLTNLHLGAVDLSTWFMGQDTPVPHTFKESLRGLDNIVITEPVLSGGDWSPLTNFLSHRAAVGNRISSLRLRGHPRIGDDVVESIERAVKVVDIVGHRQAHRGLV